MAHFSGKRALITGGSSGIGLAVARALVAEGADVCVVARDPERLEAARAALAEHARDGRRVLAVTMDVTNAASVKSGVARALELLGDLDLLVNNAGAATPGYIESQDDATCQAMLDVNYLGPVRVTHALLPHFMQRRGGAIVNVSSMLGFMGFFGYAAYAGSKYALAGFTECLRQDLLPFGVAVSICYPPTTETPGLTQENKIKPPESWAIEGKSKTYAPEHVAAELLRGVRRGKPAILVGASSKMVWRLQRWFPGLVRRLFDGALRKQLARHGDGRAKLAAATELVGVSSASNDPRRDV